MTDANDAPCIAESLDEQLNHAAEELITGDSDDPPLSEEEVVEMLNDAHAQGLISVSRRPVVKLGFRAQFGLNLVQSAHTRRKPKSGLGFLNRWTILAGGGPVTFGTIDASAQGIDQIMWFLRPSKLAAVSKSGQRMSDRYAPGPAVA
jgi:hypothetical protein